MKNIKIITLMVSLVFVSVLTFIGAANAQSFKAGDNVGVSVGETVNSMFFAGGNNVDIAGIVNGDIYCAGQTVNISGTVNGDIFCAGQTINVSGTVDGSVRLAGQSVNISGTISSSATVGSQNLVIDKDAVIGRDLLGGGQNITISGQVVRDVTVGANVLSVNGLVGRDINGRIESINVGSAGSVAGIVNYTGKNQISIASGGVVIGEVTRTEPRASQSFEISPETAIATAIGSFIYMLIATIIFALVVALMFPKVLENSVASTMKAPGKTVLTGLIAMIVAPVLMVVLLMTAVGAPLALLAFLSWLIIMLLGGSFAGYLLGKLIMRGSKQPLLIMLVGISIIVVAMVIPIVNFIVFIVAGMLGIGAILTECKKLFERANLKKA